jgi:26S proteasome non-ATPase regulatory subunit 5
MTVYMDIAEQPFTDIRCALFRVLTAMATQPWAQAEFRDHPTFCEFLLNRTTEKSKSGKEGKYDIVRTLVDSPTAMEVMGRVYYVKLKAFYKEGPFFVQAQSAVAMDSET